MIEIIIGLPILVAIILVVFLLKRPNWTAQPNISDPCPKCGGASYRLNPEQGKHVSRTCIKCGATWDAGV